MFSRLRPLFPYLRRYRRSFASGGLALIVYNAAKVMIPLIIGGAANDIKNGLSVAKVEHYAIRLVAAATVAAVTLYLTRQIIIGASREIEFDLRNDLFAYLESQPPEFFQRHRTGDIMAHSTNDLNAVRQLLGPAIMYSANTIVFTAFALPFMLRISPRLTMYAFLPLPFASVLVQYFGARIHTRFERIQAMFSDITAQAEESFSAARLIRAFAQEEAQIASFETSNQEYIRRSLLLARLMAMLWPTLELVLGVSLVVTLFVGGHEVVLHNRDPRAGITVGQFVTYINFMFQLIWPMIAIGWVVNLFQRGTASVVRIDELLKQQPAIADDPGLKPASTPLGHIEFSNLNFTYPTGGPEVLHNISLEIPAGSSLAIVGPTGSGKSSLVGLIPRLHDAPIGAGGESSSSILIDGRPIRNYTLAELRAAIGFVPQETFLFSDTIAQNIAFGRPDATQPEILEAATIAHIAAEILEFPRGFDTAVGERGITLSGGQKQRIAIARAVIRNPPILILDDALASVDTYTEERILSGLREVMRGRTTIFISHRISTARNADQIAVLVAGRIAELGTHEELIARNGYYTALAEKQQLEEELAVAG
jgi:ATP-binding cassette subfamily B protein